MSAVYFVCPDTNAPVGGIKQIYRHAAILARDGVDAWVLHGQEGFSCDWFPHQSRVASLRTSLPRRIRSFLGRVEERLIPPPDLRLMPGRVLVPTNGSAIRVLTEMDTVVLPEFYGALLEGACTQCKVIVFNQNAYGTFRGWGTHVRPSTNVYAQRNTLGAVCVSEHNRRYLTHAFPNLPVQRTINGIDLDVFYFERRPRRNQIAYMPRKLAHHLEQVIQILMLRGKLADWTLVPIDGLSETKVAETLRDSSVFLSSCEDEGFGLPPLEAALCGCLVVGYTGYAADEYLDPRYAWPVRQNDVLAFAQTLEAVVERCSREPDGLDRQREEFAALLSARYSLQREANSVLSAWRLLCPECFPVRATQSGFIDRSTSVTGSVAASVTS
ncbi:MAG: glycosyltransferase family 4 protein [Polyangiaceae bacterium]